MGLLTFVEFPYASTTLATLGAWSRPVFDEFLPLALSVAGIIIGCLLVAFFAGFIWRWVAKVFSKDKF